MMQSVSNTTQSTTYLVLLWTYLDCHIRRLVIHAALFWLSFWTEHVPKMDIPPGLQSLHQLR
eukprot:752361-Karenia_brevis.AAC.1